MTEGSLVNAGPAGSAATSGFGGRHRRSGGWVQPPRGRLRIHVRESGERWPLHVDGGGQVSLPLCVYMAAVVRRTESVNTRLQLLRGAADFLDFAKTRGISLDERFRTGRFLDVHELHGFDAHLAACTGSGPHARARRHRGALAYARFLARRHAAWQADDAEARTRHTLATGAFLEDFASVIKRCGPGPAGVGRHGLDRAGRRALSRFLADPLAQRALWTDEFVAMRNVLLVLWFAVTGHRVGEALSLQLGDLDLDGGLFRILRRPDLAADPRPRQPLVKGFSRELVLPGELLAPLRAYLAECALRPPAASNPFVFVTHGGVPMSRSLVAKVFAGLREAVPKLGKDFGPHVLRHDWNDRRSEAEDGSGMDADRKLRSRMRWMGWSDPETLANYTGRSDAQAADEIGRIMQEQLFGADGRAA